MPVVTFRRSDLCRVIGRDVALDALAQRMPTLGGDLDKADAQADAITIEWFPNRPDLLVLEGTGRAMRAFLDVKPGLPSYEVHKPRTELRVDPAVAAVRPFAALCFVRGVPFDDAYVQTVVDAQEKLTHSPGRRRRKVAIGVHDAAGLRGPFTYTVVGPAEKPFVALGGTRPMTPQEILNLHAKGQEYGHLIPSTGPATQRKFPIFLEASGDVISMPPIINAARTAVTAKTRDVLLDVTGTDSRAVRQTIALLATCFAERGGTIEAVTVHDASGTWTSPDLRAAEHVLHTDDIGDLLGRDWSGEEAARCLQRMGHGAQAYDNKVHVQVGAWRQDILHPVDLIEDVGIGFGFDKFPGELPKAATFGGKLAHQGVEDALRELLVGHGWNELRTLTLSDAASQWTKWGAQVEPTVTLLNPVVENQTLLRRRLAPSLLEVLAANRHRSLPQRVFEIGMVVQPEGQQWRNRWHVAGVEVDAKANFSSVKGLVESLARDARIGLRIEPGATPGLAVGRGGLLRGARGETGWFGELHPDTLVAFGLTAPAVAFEFALPGAPMTAPSGKP
jgi:phenylalanyl-tRNA synthetase beta chain